MLRTNRRNLLKLVGIAGTGLITSTGSSTAQTKKVDVIIKPKNGNKKAVKSAVKKSRGNINKEYNNFDYITISVPKQALNGLKNNPNVDKIESDIDMSLVGNHKSRRPPVSRGKKKKPVVGPNRSTGNSSKRRSQRPVKGSPGRSNKSDIDAEEEETTDSTQSESESTEEEIESTTSVSSWGIERIGAYNTDVDGSSASVVILDTGVDTTHDDITVQDQVDFTGKGTGDENGHGTHVAGVVGANGGLVGVAPATSVYSAKVLDSSGYGSLSDVLSGIDWAMDKGIRTMNMSLGTPTDSDILQETVAKARDKGFLIISAAGNEGNNQDGSCEEQNVLYPAKYDSVLSVSAMNENEKIAAFSSVGNEVDIMAPGSSIASTYLNNDYATLSGTSMASPHVAGVVSLLVDVGYTNPDKLETQIESTSEIVIDSCGEGSGLVDAESAVNTTNDEEDTTEENNTEEDTTEDNTEENTEEEDTTEEDDSKDKRDRPPGSPAGKKPSLPSQASSQAKNILSKIFG